MGVDQSYHRTPDTEWPFGSYKVDSPMDMALRGLKDRQHLDIQARRVTTPSWVYRLDLRRERGHPGLGENQPRRYRLVQQIPQQGWIGFQQGVRGIGRWDAKGLSFVALLPAIAVG